MAETEVKNINGRKICDTTARDQIKENEIRFSSQLKQIETKNIEQDNRLKDIEYKNKVQDVYIGGLFNENADGRLSIEDEGNDLKLEESKQGLVEVEKVVGNTLVNIMPIGKFSNPSNMGTGIVGSVHSVKFNTLPLKPNTIYTSIMFNAPNTLSNYWYHKLSVEGKITGKVAKFTTVSDISVANSSLYLYSSEDNPLTREELDKIKIIILEGDYTNKPIPSECFEGMQSTFEDKLITQEMVDAGEELAENLGKYRVGVKVVGKNLFDEKSQIKAGNWLQGEYKNGKIHLKNDGSQRCVYLVRAYFEYGKMYCLSYHNLEGSSKYVNLGVLHPMLPNGNVDTSTSSTFNCGTRKFDLPSGYYYIRFYTDNLTSEDYYVNYMLEEVELISSNSTPYEPYKEYKTSILLDSPLTKYDEICVQDGQLGVLRGGESTILDGTICTANGNTDVLSEYIVSSAVSNVYNTVSANNLITDRLSALYSNTEQCIFLTGATPAFRVRLLTANYSTPTLAKAWLQTNPITVVYKLAEPYFEKISDDKFISEIPNDATLHIDSVIPCQSVKASYTGNVPSVYGMEKNLNNVNDEQAMQNEIDNTTMLAVADVYEMLMPVATMSLNAREGGNKMVELYVVLIMRGLKTIDQVPSTIRPQVEEMLKQVQ